MRLRRKFSCELVSGLTLWCVLLSRDLLGTTRIRVLVAWIARAQSSDDDPIMAINEPDPNVRSDLPKYLYCREGTFYFKRKIPTDVAKAFSPAKGAVWRSLGVSSVEAALEPLAEAVADFESTVTQARASNGDKVPAESRPREGKTTKFLLEAHIPALLARYEYFHLENDDALRSVLSEHEREERVQEFEYELQELRKDVATNNFSALEEVMQDLLTNEGLIAPPETNARVTLLRELAWKDIEILEAQLGRLKGIPARTPAIPMAPRLMLTVAGAFDAWKKSQTQARTIKTFAGYVEDFERLNRALPLEAISRLDVRKYVEHLSQNKGLAKETVKNHVMGLGTLVNFALKDPECRLQRNPFADASFASLSERPASEDWRAFEVNELTALFRSPIYTKGEKVEGQATESAYWTPLMGPFIGGRIEEVAQLRMEDIQCINGNWVLRIADLDEFQHLKTTTSYRYVPIHHELIRCGFLSYVAKQKLAGHTRVFPSQRNENTNRIWSNALGKWHGRYLRRIGLCDTRLVYHSYRLTFKQRCSLSGVEDEARDALTGHWISKDSAGRRYMRGQNRQYRLPLLVRAMSLLAYDELDLSHLYVKEPMAYVEEAFKMSRQGTVKFV